MLLSPEGNLRNTNDMRLNLKAILANHNNVIVQPLLVV